MEITDRPRPESLSDLFFSFTWLALQGFGGVLAVVQQELVERKRWMTNEEFIENWAVAQILPGPNVINISIMIGSRYFGLRGAIAAMSGMVVFPLLILLLLTITYLQFSSIPAVAGALRGMGAVAAGLIMGTGLKMLPALRKNPLGLSLCAGFSVVCFVCIGFLHWPLVYVLFGLGGIACVITWRRLGQ